MSDKERRLPQEPGWVKDYNEAPKQGKGVMFPAMENERPITKKDLLDAWNAGRQSVHLQAKINTFEQWFEEQHENRK